MTTNEDRDAKWQKQGEAHSEAERLVRVYAAEGPEMERLLRELQDGKIQDQYGDIRGGYLTRVAALLRRIESARKRTHPIGATLGGEVEP